MTSAADHPISTTYGHKGVLPARVTVHVCATVSLIPFSFIQTHVDIWFDSHVSFYAFKKSHWCVCVCVGMCVFVCECVCYLPLSTGNCHCLHLIGLGGHQQLMQPAAIKSSI